MKVRASQRLAAIAKVLAMEVRNSMENCHVQHLTDEQMHELNPIIRTPFTRPWSCWSVPATTATGNEIETPLRASADC